jgi:hypothetical protein
MRKITLSLSLILLGLTTFPLVCFAQNETVRAYEGSARPDNELVTLRFKGNKMAVRLWVFKVDGKLAPSDGFYNTFNCTPTGNIDLNLLPGEHVLEIQCTTNNPQTITFTGEAGKEYQFEISKDQVTLVEEGKPVSVTTHDIPFYAEVPESEPNAVLIEDKDYGVTFLYRIDGLPGEILAKGWVAHHMFNNSMKGNYVVRLAPGEHTLDYSGSMDNVQRLTSGTFTFEAGKKYTLAHKVKELSGIRYLESSLVEIK